MSIKRSTAEDILLIGLLAFAPLALASVHTWAYCTIAIVSLILFDLHFLQHTGLVEESNSLLSLIKVLKIPISIGLLLLLGIIFLYTIPLPLAIIKILSPATYKLRETYMLDPASWHPLSLYPRATITYLIKFPTYIMLFLVVVSKIVHKPLNTEYEIRNTNMSDEKAKFEHYMHQKTSNFLILGALCSILCILLHSLVDFNLQIPANAIYFTLMIAIVTGLTCHRSDHKKDIDYSFLNKL